MQLYIIEKSFNQSLKMSTTFFSNKLIAGAIIFKYFKLYTEIVLVQNFEAEFKFLLTNGSYFDLFVGFCNIFSEILYFRNSYHSSKTSTLCQTFFKNYFLDRLKQWLVIIINSIVTNNSTIIKYTEKKGYGLKLQQQFALYICEKHTPYAEIIMNFIITLQRDLLRFVVYGKWRFLLVKNCWL